MYLPVCKSIYKYENVLRMLKLYIHVDMEQLMPHLSHSLINCSYFLALLKQLGIGSASDGMSDMSDTEFPSEVSDPLPLDNMDGTTQNKAAPVVPPRNDEPTQQSPGKQGILRKQKVFYLNDDMFYISEVHLLGMKIRDENA